MTYTYIVVTQRVGEFDVMHRSPSLLRVDSETEMSHRDMQWFLKPHGYNPTTDSLDFKELSQITNIT
jgi:hypothetical protein